MAAAELTGVDAIHPGYGFLSENAEFAAVCLQYGINFIGPTPEQIRLLGNKVEARALAKKAGVPMLPGSQGRIESESHCEKLAAEIGYPLIIKAAAGGGGRGMKIVHRREDLIKLFRLAQTEAVAAFGSGDCFMERYLTRPRHVEVQIMGDNFGNVIHIGERDCSIQRRQQKLVEESPCPIFTPELRERIGATAVALAREVRYSSLGTVEFLFDDGQFYFMEVNTRVQVEHPVTEEVSGLDLVKEQIRLAQGNPLSIRQEDVQLRGHAMECRINAEDPDTFAPWPGLVSGYHEPGGPGVRVDGMIYSGYRVPSLYDSLLAKVIVRGRDRMECIVRMRRALAEMRVDGIRSNIRFYQKLLQDERFIRGDISISYLEKEFLKKPVV
jgi:acetyl-CoA carboxylase biotin carboxylase subunit